MELPSFTAAGAVVTVTSDLMMTPPLSPPRDDAFASTLDSVMALKPLTSIQRLFDALLPHSTPLSGGHSRAFDRQRPMLYLLTAGVFGLSRWHDELELSRARAPHLFGLAELLLPLARTTRVHFSPQSTVFAVSGAHARTIMSAQPALWEDAASVLAFHLHVAAWRDLHLLTDRAYDTVRGKLLELARQCEGVRESTSVQHYILSTTRLSRSRVLGILKDLVTGGYVDIHRGKLRRIVRLPLRY